MDENELKMNKYARKQLAKQRGTWNAPEVSVAVAVAVDPGKPKGCADAPAARAKRRIADLGDRPERLASLLAAARDTIAAARKAAGEMMDLSASGVQRTEPNALCGFLDSMADRLEEMAQRARCIPNAKED